MSHEVHVMDVRVSLDEVISRCRALLGGATNPQGFAETNRWRKNILNDKSYIFVFIKYLCTEQLDKEEQDFLIQIIQSFIEVHHTRLTLHEIITQLTNIDYSLISCRSISLKLGDLIASIARILYQTENKFVFDISDEVTSCTDLEWSIFYCLIDRMGENRQDCTSDQNREVNSGFSRDYLPSFFRLSIRTIQNSPQESVHLMLQCFKYPGQVLLSNYNNFHIFDDTDFFNNFIEIATTMTPPASAETVQIIHQITKPFHYAIPEFNQLHDNVCSFIISIFQCGEFFNYDSNICSLNTFISEIKMVTHNCCWQAIIGPLIDFVNFVIENRFEIAIATLPSFSKMLSTYPLSIKEKDFKESFSILLSTFLEKALKHLFNIPQMFESLTSDIKPMKNCLMFLWGMTGNEMEKTAEYVAQTMNEIYQDEFTIQANYPLCFLILMAKVIMVNSKGFKSKVAENNEYNPTDIVMDTVFQIVMKTQEYYEEYRLTLIQIDKDENRLEYFIIKFFSSFIKKYICKKSNNCASTKFPIISNFESANQVTLFIFQRILMDMQNNLCYTYAKRAIIKFVDANNQHSSTIECFLETDYPQTLFDDYLNLPCKSTIYYVLVKIMFCDAELYKSFLQSLQDNFAGKYDDEDEMKKLFKILACLFKTATKDDEWQNLYLYFSSTFSDICIKCTEANSWPELLRFICKLVITLPSSNPFSTNTPHALRLFKFLVQLLTTLSRHIRQFLSPIEVDNAIFESAFNISEFFESKPISLSESHDIGFDKKLMKMHSGRFSLFISQKSDTDKYWEYIVIVLTSAANLIKSPFPNYGILEMYNDRCVYDLFNEIIAAINSTTIISIHSYPSLVVKLSDYLAKMTSYFHSEIINNKNYFEFVRTITRMQFLSHDLEVLNNTHIALIRMIEFFEPEVIMAFRGHFILSLNLTMYCCECSSASEFILDYFILDQEFVKSIGEMIANELETPDIRKQFIENYDSLMDNTPKSHIQEEFNKWNKMFSLYQSKICPLHIKLYCLPSLSNYFVFH